MRPPVGAEDYHAFHVPLFGTGEKNKKQKEKNKKQLKIYINVRTERKIGKIPNWKDSNVRKKKRKGGGSCSTLVDGCMVMVGDLCVRWPLFFCFFCAGSWVGDDVVHRWKHI